MGRRLGRLHDLTGSFSIATKRSETATRQAEEELTSSHVGYLVNYHPGELIFMWVAAAMVWISRVLYPNITSR